MRHVILLLRIFLYHNFEKPLKEKYFSKLKSIDAKDIEKRSQLKKRFIECLHRLKGFNLFSLTYKFKKHSEVDADTNAKITALYTELVAFLNEDTVSAVLTIKPSAPITSVTLAAGSVTGAASEAVSIKSAVFLNPAVPLGAAPQTLFSENTDDLKPKLSLKELGITGRVFVK